MMIDNDFGSLSPEHQFLAQYLPKVPKKRGGPMTIVNMPSQALDTQLALDSMGFMQGML